ncbi:Ras family GTPase [Starmerella bacillaris]|uniref:Ras family GTPase n=1 Tax=Starmerella bacillaris TaxID=1247836 RepID=A0AAV5RIK4_STABA|nr:Ras family GTPase [Starmerella bacillaris]
MTTPVKEYQLVVMGSGGVGKSTLSVQFIQGQFVDEYDPTIEDSYRKELVVDGETVSLDILDTAGQEEYSAMREQYMKTGQGFLLVFSVTSRSSFDEISVLHQQIMRAKNNDSNYPILLVGNKCDLEDQREVPKEEGTRLANRLNLTYIETSAKTRTNVEESFTMLASRILKYEKQQVVNARSRVQSQHAPARATPAQPQPTTPAKEESNCCIVA